MINSEKKNRNTSSLNPTERRKIISQYGSNLRSLSLQKLKTDKKVSKKDSLKNIPEVSENKKRLRINTNKCMDDLRIIKLLIKQNDWKEVFDLKCDIYWITGKPNPDQFSIGKTIPFNKIPGMTDLCEKKKSAYMLNLFYSLYHDEFDFYPKSYNYPEDTRNIIQSISLSKNPYLAKPSDGSQGDGIKFITKNNINSLEYSNSNNYVVQEYIKNPLLINKKKFDLRLYVLISSTNPYIIYLNKEGLARFCTEEYEAPNEKNIQKCYSHFTNYSLNKNSKNYKYTEEVEDESDGSKISLASLWKLIKTKFFDNNEKIFEESKATLWNQIQILIRKYCVAMYPFMMNYVSSVYKNSQNKCFHILGFDILVDSDWKPWILEVNASPSLSVEHDNYLGDVSIKVSPVDMYVKQKVVLDAISIITSLSVEEQLDFAVGTYHQSYCLILKDYDDEYMSSMDIVERLRNVFNLLKGNTKVTSILSFNQFNKLSLIPEMINEKMLKIDYSIMFNTQCKGGASFNSFIKIFEKIINKLESNSELKQDRLSMLEKYILICEKGLK